MPPISPRGEPPLPPPRDVRMGFAIEKYTGFDEYVAELSALRDADPSRVTTHSDRTTYSGGYPLYWVTLGDTRKPAILIVSVLHARHEWQGAHLTLAFLRKLLDPEDDQRDFNSRLLDQLCVIAIPMVNVWGYFASPDGVHHNNHGAPVAGIERADWHDMTNYRYYHGVNLNRNFDWNWDAYPSLPWSVRRYWNGSDYGFANYFMMPFHLDEHGNEVFDPENAYPNHILKPDAAVFDYKGEAPFSEPETQLVRDLFARYRVAGFIDVHLMNSWHSRNASYISRSVDREWVTRWVDDAIAAVNRRNRSAGAQLPATQHIVMEEYDGNAPYSVNWAQNEMRVRSFAWETGTAFPEPIWTDAYMEMFYRAVSWMQTEAR
ncbi:MAG TPA: M14 family zinc carboxypeptidase [Myxococcota bacterium]|nr:M14 family zinc carboxypeptidase [Myxococcota bacterium]